MDGPFRRNAHSDTENPHTYTLFYFDGANQAQTILRTVTAI
jgi:hypothetical protein